MHAEGLVTSRSQFNAHSRYCQKHPAHEIYPKLGAVSIQVSMHPNRCADTLSSKTKWDLAQCAFTRKELIQLSTRLLLIKNAVKSWIRDCLTDLLAQSSIQHVYSISIADKSICAYGTKCVDASIYQRFSFLHARLDLGRLLHLLCRDSTESAKQSIKAGAPQRNQDGESD